MSPIFSLSSTFVCICLYRELRFVDSSEKVVPFVDAL